MDGSPDSLPEENVRANGERAWRNELALYRVLSPDSAHDRGDFLLAAVRPAPRRGTVRGIER